MGPTSPIYRCRPARLPGWWAVLAAGLALTGCAARAGEARPLTACDLLGAAEVAAAFGAPVQPPAAGQGSATDALAGRSGCAWASVDGSRALLVELVRTPDMASSVRRTGFSAEARFAAARARHPGATEVADVGGRAVYSDGDHTLHLLVGASYLTVEVAVPPPDDPAVVAASLARRAASRVAAHDRAD